jgi:type II secretory pathway pseudopilin PulG
VNFNLPARMKSPKITRELTIAGVILLILIAIAVPKYQSLNRDMRAAQAVAEMQAVRAAAYMYYAKYHKWPHEEPNGDMPKGLLPYLQKNLALSNNVYRIDWENWVVDASVPAKRGRAPKGGEPRVLVGISLVSPDRGLLKSARGLLAAERVIEVAANRSTLIISTEADL